MYRLILLSLVAVAAAHTCGPVTTVDHFQFTEFAQGTWYELARYKGLFKGKNCGRVEYTPQGDSIKIKNCIVYNGEERCIEGVGKMDPAADNHGKLIYTYPEGPSREMVDNNISVIATDYKTYAIVHFCKHDDEKNIHVDLAWVMGRSKKLSAEDKERVTQIIKDTPALKLDNFVDVDFSDDACKITE